VGRHRRTPSLFGRHALDPPIRPRPGGANRRALSTRASGCNPLQSSVDFSFTPVSSATLANQASSKRDSFQIGVHIPLFQNPQTLAVGFHISWAPGAHGAGGGCGGAHGGGGPQGPQPAGPNGPPGRCQSWQ
jgi:hypothetical protein